jgi:hypothetical protein
MKRCNKVVAQTSNKVAAQMWPEVLLQACICVMKQTDFGNIYAVYVLATVYVTKSNSAYVDWKTFLSRLNIAGPKPG